MIRPLPRDKARKGNQIREREQAWKTEVGRLIRPLPARKGLRYSLESEEKRAWMRKFPSLIMIDPLMSKPELLGTAVLKIGT